MRKSQTVTPTGVRGVCGDARRVALLCLLLALQLDTGISAPAQQKSVGGDSDVSTNLFVSQTANATEELSPAVEGTVAPPPPSPPLKTQSAKDFKYSLHKSKSNKSNGAAKKLATLKRKTAKSFTKNYATPATAAAAADNGMTAAIAMTATTDNKIPDVTLGDEPGTSPGLPVGAARFESATAATLTAAGSLHSPEKSTKLNTKAASAAFASSTSSTSLSGLIHPSKPPTEITSDGSSLDEESGKEIVSSMPDDDGRRTTMATTRDFEEGDVTKTPAATTTTTATTTPRITESMQTTSIYESSSIDGRTEDSGGAEDTTGVAGKDAQVPESISQIKLIDLENHEDMKSIQSGLSSSSTRATPAAPPSATTKKVDVGHDGVKATKKKQLIEKHFARSGVTDDSGGGGGGRPPLVPVANGYLGPIFMDEKSFSGGGAHLATEKSSHSHRSSIESQILSGKLVEIFAPIEDVKTTAAAPAILHKPLTAYHSHSSEDEVLSSTVFHVRETVTADAASARRQTSTETQNAADTLLLPILSTTNYDLRREGVGGVDSIAKAATVADHHRAESGGKAAEPAAIEIHINVSEGFGNESEDLEFSYRQSADNPKSTSRLHADFITLRPFDAGQTNDTSAAAVAAAAAASSIEPDEILVVEIIDSGGGGGGIGNDDNSTENSASRENPNPIFTFRSDGDTEVELKDVKYFNEEGKRNSRRKEVDDLFLPHLKKDELKSAAAPVQPPVSAAAVGKTSTIDHDSDTIFYISNTEVKVGESLPTANTKLQQRSRPAPGYEYLTHADRRHKEFEEKIRQQAPPLDVTYVGESIIEVEQSPPSGSGSTTPPPMNNSDATRTSSTIGGDVIIQPAILPEMAIGVPVIGELPPQIELRGIDFGGGGGGMADSESESSIQYGGDLIDERGVIAGGAFDSPESGYPFGNLAAMHQHQRGGASSQQAHVVNNLRRDELIADLVGSVEAGGFQLKTNNSAPSMNGSSSSNATAYSVMEEPTAADDFNFTDVQTLVVACVATLLPLVLSVFMAFGLRHLYRKYQAHPIDQSLSTDQLANDKSGSRDHEEPSQAAAIGRPRATNSGQIEITGGNLPSNSSCYSIAPPPPPPPGPNGSVTKMTLKNNHLIVETEERNDISRDARETKMHYNTAEKDGVFVVEVSRGIDSKMPMPSSPIGIGGGIDVGSKRVPMMDGAMVAKQQQNCTLLSAAAFIESKDVAKQKLMNHEQVLIHQPPPEHPSNNSNNNVSGATVVELGLHQIDEVDELNASPRSTANEMRANTGLSQSDLSSTSSQGSNKRYSYGNQELYTAEQSGYSRLEPIAKTPASLAQNHSDGDHKSENGHCLDEGQQLPPPPSSAEKNPPTQQQQQQQEKSEPEQGGESQKETKLNGHVQCNGSGTIEIESDDIEIHSNGNCLKLKVDDEEIPKEANDGAEGRQDDGGDAFDSIVSLPEPPTTEEIIEMADINLTESINLDSLPPLPPPPPPPVANGVAAATDLDLHRHQNGNGYEETPTPPSASPTKKPNFNFNSAPTPATPPSSPYPLSNGKKMSSFQLHHHHRQIPTIAVDVTGCS